MNLGKFNDNIASKRGVIKQVLTAGGKWDDLLGPVNEALESNGMAPFATPNSLRAFCSRWGLVRNPRPVKRSKGKKDKPVTREPVRKSVEGVEFEENHSKGEAVLTVNTPEEIRTVEDAVAYANIDLDYWEPYRSKAGRSTVTISGKKSSTGEDIQYGNYVMMVWFRKRRANPGLEAAKIVAEDIKGGRIKVPAIRIRKGPIGNGVCGYIGAHDHHFAKLAWREETGTDYDLKIAEFAYVDAAEREVAKAAKCYSMKEWVLPIGHDFFQINNDDGTTKKGTPMDFEGRLPKIIRVAKRAVIKTVMNAVQVAPITIKWIPGNHDPETSFYLCMILEEAFRDNKHVTVDVSAAPRKYHRWGTNLFGLTHGNEEKHIDLPNIMAGSVPHDWAETTDRWWFLGHFHKKKELHFVLGDTYGSVVVQILPSLSGVDAWHFRKGYVNGMRAWETYYFDFEDGFLGTGVAKIRKI